MAEESGVSNAQAPSSSITKMSKPEPVTLLCSTPSTQLVAAALNTTVYLIDSSTSSKVAQTIAEDQHQQRIRLMAATNDKLVSTGDDKLLKVWALPAMKLLSTRSLPKRANALSITEDGQTIAVGDKFGDVYSLLLDANQEFENTGVKEAQSTAEQEKDAEKRQPVLGHVSMLTDLAFYNSSEYGQTIITSDRDEHIRVSKWPRGLEIVQYLLGHLKFVSSLLVDEKQSMLYSAGGEEELYLWDLKQMKLNSKRDISILRDYAQIPSPARQQGHNPSKKKKGKQQQQAQAGDEPQEADPTTSQQETESERQIRIQDEKPIVVDQIFALSESWLGVTSLGASAVLAVHRHDPNQASQVLDLGAPILSLSRLPGDKHLASLDLVHGSTKDPKPEKSFATFSFKSGKFDRTDDASLIDALSSLSSSDAPYPSTETLYPDLSLLYKDSNTGEGLQGEGMESTAPRDRKVGKAPANKLEKAKKGPSHKKQKTQ